MPSLRRIARLAIVLGLQGSYRKGKTASPHALIAAIGPAIGSAAMALDNFERGGTAIFLAPNLVALAMAAIPLPVHDHAAELDRPGDATATADYRMPSIAISAMAAPSANRSP